MSTKTEAERLVDAWENAMTIRAHVAAGNAMAEELARLSAANKELLADMKLIAETSHVDACLAAMHLHREDARAVIAKHQPPEQESTP